MAELLFCKIRSADFFTASLHKGLCLLVGIKPSFAMGHLTDEGRMVSTEVSCLCPLANIFALNDLQIIGIHLNTLEIRAHLNGVFRNMIFNREWMPKYRFLPASTST